MSKRVARKTRKQRFNQRHFDAIAGHMEHLIEDDLERRAKVAFQLNRQAAKVLGFGIPSGMSPTGRTYSKITNMTMHPRFEEYYAKAMAPLMFESMDYGELELSMLQKYAEKDAQVTLDMYNRLQLHKVKATRHV